MTYVSRVVTISVGNTRTRVGVFEEGALVESQAVPNADESAVRQALAQRLGPNDRPDICAMASVHAAFAERVEGWVAELSDGQPPTRLGVDLPIPLRHALDDASTLGQDRMLNAIAAFSRTRQACVVVDVGTAVTVDFIDGHGVFHGGIIFPGVRMMLRALHLGTAALPEIGFSPPDPARGPLGKDTVHAMTLGAMAAIRGGVRAQVERCADMYGAYPQIIATGGDAQILEEESGIIEHFVPDLVLIGLHECVAHAMRDEDS